MIMFTPWLRLTAVKNEIAEANAVGYEALTPTELESDKASGYIDVLNYAFTHPDIRNIAVTGPYGAGKSSVLKTWCKSKEETLRVLTVSLADFDMQKSANSDVESEDGKALENEKNSATTEKSIEYSILQQILYKHNKNELPYSRIERISGVTLSQIAKSTSKLTLTILMALVSLYFLAPEYLTAKFSLPGAFSRYLLEHPLLVRLPGGVLSVAGTLCLLLSQLHRIGIFDKKVSLDKVDILKGAVTAKASAPSLLNVYIDEIVYFFDTTKYDVVIFEDLDRLNNNRIFIKLREINQIINNCLADRQPLKFIYAVRDELFSSAESRTKFFDFVMPVIPVMDNENASDHFSKKFTEEEKEHVGLNECISRIAAFIPDMRVMHNITNEFRLYQNIVNNRENIPRLLSMIAYKNLCAEDYHGIDQKRGIVFHFINSYVERRIHERYILEIDKQILINQERLELIENEKNTHKSALRKELLSPYINDIHQEILSFRTDTGITWRLKEVVEDESCFMALINGKGINTYHPASNHYIIRTGSGDSELIRASYAERCVLIDEKISNGILRIKNNIISLEAVKRRIRSESVSDFTNRMQKTEFSDWVKICVNDNIDPNQRMVEQIDFIYFLLSSGYLSTDYMSFRSIFMPGGLTENDNTFIKAVMSGNDVVKSFSIPLENTKNVVARLKKLGVIERENAQHPAVICWLIDNEPDTLADNTATWLNQTNSQRAISILMLVQKEFPIDIRFRYLEIIVSDIKILKKLLEHLCASEQREMVQEITACLLCLSKNTILRQSTEIKEIFGTLITSLPQLVIAVPEGYGDAFFETLKSNSLSVSYIPLITDSQNRELIRKISASGLFKYSPNNIENIYLTLKKNEDEDGLSFSRRPLHCLESLQMKELDKILWENINDFISSVFIGSMETERIPQLLNSESVSMSSAELIMNRMTFSIDQIELIHNKCEIKSTDDTVNKNNTYSMLLSYNRISPSIENFVYLLHDKTIDTANELVQWVNNKHREFTPCNIIFTSSEVFNNFLVKFLGSAVLSEGALLTVLSCLDIVITEIPETIPFRNAEILYVENKLAPTICVFTGLYVALSREPNYRQRMNTLLSNLIALRPAMLLEEPDEIFYVADKFDDELARKLFNHRQINANIKTDALRWLRDNKPGVLDEHLLLSLHTLSELSVGMDEDGMRLLLLKNCLSAGDADKDTLRVVLNSFTDENYHGLLPQATFRKIPYTFDLWALAELLNKVGLIHPPKMGSGRDEEKIIINSIRYNNEEEPDE